MVIICSQYPLKKHVGNIVTAHTFSNKFAEAVHWLSSTCSQNRMVTRACVWRLPVRPTYNNVLCGFSCAWFTWDDMAPSAPFDEPTGWQRMKHARTKIQWDACTTTCYVLLWSLWPVHVSKNFAWILNDFGVSHERMERVGWLTGQQDSQVWIYYAPMSTYTLYI